nr:MAG TPA: hypothetical protein [Caudoviricetes sp.]
MCCMKTIKDYTNEQLRYGIARCKARLTGILPFGLMRNETMVKEALKEYRNELQKRGQNELDFK